MCQLSVREASAADLSDDRGDELRLERGLEGATLRDGQHPGQLVRRGLLGHAITSCIRRWVCGFAYKTAWQMDARAASAAIRLHGGIGYTRHKPFEHIYRNHTGRVARAPASVLTAV